MVQTEVYMILKLPNEERYMASFRSNLTDRQADTRWKQSEKGEQFHVGSFNYRDATQYESAIQIIEDFVADLNSGADVSSQTLDKQLEKV